MAATSVCLVICPNHSNNLERKFRNKLFCLSLSAGLSKECDVFRLLRSQITTTCISTLFWHFQQTLWNIAIYRNLRNIAMYRDIIVSWPMYRDAYRIVKYLPMPRPVLLLCTFLMCSVPSFAISSQGCLVKFVKLLICSLVWICSNQHLPLTLSG